MKEKNRKQNKKTEAKGIKEEVRGKRGVMKQKLEKKQE